MQAALVKKTVIAPSGEETEMTVRGKRRVKFVTGREAEKLKQQEAEQREARLLAKGPTFAALQKAKAELRRLQWEPQDTSPHSLLTQRRAQALALAVTNLEAQLREEQRLGHQAKFEEHVAGAEAALSEADKLRARFEKAMAAALKIGAELAAAESRAGQHGGAANAMKRNFGCRGAVPSTSGGSVALRTLLAEAANRFERGEL